MNGEGVPDIVLERYRLGELPASERARIDDLLRRQPQLRQRLASLDRSDEEWRRTVSPEQLAAQVRTRLAGSTTRGARGWHAVYWSELTALAIALVLLFIVVPRTVDRASDSRPVSTGAGGSGDDRIKGLRPSLTIYRRTANGSESLADGAVARAGDLLRVGYRAAGKAYGAIISIDSRRSITVHLPPNGERAAALRRESTVLLDHAYELDDAPDWERFYFITGDTPFAVPPVVDAIRRATAARGAVPPALVLPGGLEQATFSIQKEARP